MSELLRKKFLQLATLYSSQGEDGEFRWSDGWAVHYTAWEAGQPGSGDCVAMNNDGRWRAHLSACTYFSMYPM